METIQLAPAAGAGIGKVFADALLARPDFVEAMVEAAMGGLRAMAPARWDKEEKTWVRDEDFRVRMQAVGLILSHMEGEPVKRILHQHMSQTGTLDIAGALAESPALRDAVTRTLAAAKSREHRAKAVKRELASEAVLDVD